MKKALFVFICIIAITTSANQAKANMAAGGELIYVHIADSTYQFIFKFYKDCSGSAEPDSVPLCLQDPCNSFTISLKMGKWGTPDFIRPGCPNFKTTCDSPGSALPGYKEIFYARVLTLPTRCTAWKFYTYVPNRNNSYNIQNPTSNPMYIEATFNNTISHNNSSPYYTNKPIFYSALNVPATFNIGAIDADGDSLWTSVIYPRTGITTCTDTPVNVTMTTTTPSINFTNNPIQTNNTFNLAGGIGYMSYTPKQLGLGTIAIKTREFRNGVEIGSVTRETQIPTLYMYIPPPKLDTLPEQPWPPGSGFVYGCVGRVLTLQFDIKHHDTTIKRLFITDNSSTRIPGINITYTNQGTDSIRVTISWLPDSNDIGAHGMLLMITDSTCNPPGIALQYARTIDFYIWGPTKAIKDTAICKGQVAYLSVNGGGNYQWSVLSGSPNSLSNPNVSNPVAFPTVTTTYVVTSTANPYCPNINKDTVTVFVRPTTPGANAITTSFGCGQNPAVNYINSCPGQPVSFCFNTVSSDTNARLYPSDNHNSSLPAANITYSAAGADSVYGTFSWTPGANDVGFFSVDLNTYDSACVPTSGSHLKTQTVGIYIWPPVQVDDDKITICRGDSVQLGASGSVNYQWTILPPGDTNSLSNSNIRNPYAKPDSSTSYVVTAINNIYCPDNKDTVNVHVHESKAISVRISVSPDSNIAFGSTTTFTANATTCNNPVYAWYIDGGIVPDVRGNIFTTSQILNQQQVWCRLFCNDTCANPGNTTSNIITMQVSTSVKNVETNKGFHLYPNPNNGVFTLVSDNIETGGTIEISNIYGQVVYKATITANKQQIEMNGVPAGVYMLKTVSMNKSAGAVFIVQQ